MARDNPTGAHYPSRQIKPLIAAKLQCLWSVSTLCQKTQEVGHPYANTHSQADTEKVYIPPTAQPGLHQQPNFFGRMQAESISYPCPHVCRQP